MRDYSRILALLNQIEAACPVERLAYRGVQVWPLIRHDIASQLFWEKGEGAGGNRGDFQEERALLAQLPPAPSAFSAAPTLPASLLESLADIGESRLLLLTIGYEYTGIEGRHYNRFYDPLKELLAAHGVSCQELLTGFMGNDYRDSFTPKREIGAELEFARSRVDGRQGSVIDGFPQLLETLERMGLDVCVRHKNYRVRLEQILAMAELFGVIIGRANPCFGFVVCYYHDIAMAFLLALSRAGVPSVEIQHSVISDHDWGWAGWSRVPRGGYQLLPSRFWAWGERYAALTRSAAPNLVPLVGGNLWIPAWKEHFAKEAGRRERGASQTVALYAAPFGDARMFPEIFPGPVLEAIRLSPPEIRWLVRIHYKTDDLLMEQIAAYLKGRTGRNVELHRSNEIQLYEVFETVDYQVSQTCTTVIEAEEFGVPNIIVGSEGERWYREEIGSGYYLRAGSSHELLEIMTERRRPLPRPARLLHTDPEAAWRELAALLASKEPPKGEAMPPTPHTFTIETTLACDLRCPECAIGGGMIQRKKELMSFASYKVIADKIRPYAKYVYLHIWGEPMLNPDIFEMIRYTSTFAGTNISTNGQSMTREMARALITSGVSDVIVSIDGATQEVYQKYRVGGEIGKAFDGLMYLVQENRSSGGRVNIIPQFIVFEHNQHEMEEFAARCRELGLSPSFKAPYLRNSDSRFAYCSNPAFQRPHFRDVPSLQDAMSSCPNPREVFTVLNDGSVVACCHDYAGAMSFGSILKQEVMEIWESPAFSAFRSAVTGGRAPAFCIENCMTWFLDKPVPAREAEPQRMVNLCCGPILIPGFLNIDAMPGGDLQIDLEREFLPFPDNSIDALVCISAINYFSYQRGREIVADVYRVLKPGGIVRFATQDLRLLAGRYLERDHGFYFQTLSDGRQRFPGETFCDKLNAFFYGFYSGDKHCKYVYDAESLTRHFQAAGFARIEEKGFLESAIPGPERFDNRPEQMFFLEAVKGELREQPTPESRYEKILRQKERQLEQAADSPAAFLERGLGLMTQNPERGWQLLLKALELDQGSREATRACAAVLERQERYGDLMKLYGAYLTAVPTDEGMAARAKEALVRAEAKQEEQKAEAMRRRPQLAPLDKRRNRVLSDREHLDAGVAWLRHAQGVNPAGGVAAAYYLDTRSWDVDYPETTGYIIPTFLAQYRLTGDASFRDDAIRMGEWEIDIQAPEGGAGEPYGVYGLRPRVFNTGQVLLGFVSLYRETGNGAYLQAGMRAGDWILSCLDREGKWSRGAYRGPRSYKSRVAWALLELGEVSGEERYRAGARRAIEWTLAQGEENGFFRENSLTDPDRPWTHLIGYVHVGLLEACRFPKGGFDRERTLGMLRNAAQALAGNYLQRKRNTPPGELTVFPGTFDSSWQSKDNWSCITGNAQIEFFLRRMLPHLDDPRLLQAADGMLKDLKRLQMIDGENSPDLYGGLPGAYPLGAPYCSNSIPNWGVKFFADSLLQRLLPARELDCIG